MATNASILRYGFELDREYLFEFAMRCQYYLPIISLPTIHPILQYLLFFEHKSMRIEIRVCYMLTHLALVLNEWTFGFAYRMYPIVPFGGFYCEGPMCRSDIDKQLLIAILSIPVIMITSPFVTLMARLHQMFVPIDSRWKLSWRVQIILGILLNLLLIANSVLFGMFGKDHDDSERLLKEPELAWMAKRGGIIFLFGSPGDPQYFQWELKFLALSILIIMPFLIFFTVDAMHNIARSATNLSGSTLFMAKRMYQIFLFQCMGATLCYTVPLVKLFAFMTIDATSLPGPLLAVFRILPLILFNINGTQFTIFFIVKNPTYRQIVTEKFMQVLSCKLSAHDNKEYATPSPLPSFSVTTTRQYTIRILQ